MNRHVDGLLLGGGGYNNAYPVLPLADIKKCDFNEVTEIKINGPLYNIVSYIEFNKNKIAQWQSVRLISGRSWIQSPVDPILTHIITVFC